MAEPQRLRVKPAAVAGQTRLFRRKSLPRQAKKGRRASFSFRQMSDFKGLWQIFIPASGVSATSGQEAPDNGRTRGRPSPRLAVSEGLDIETRLWGDLAIIAGIS
jgi:hypothetical protein